MSADDARTFLESVMGYTDQPNGEVASEDRPVKLGTVDALYTGTGNPKVLFDGESLMGVRTYAWVGRRPRALERVVLVPQGHTYVIIGAIGAAPGSDEPVGTIIEGLWATAPAGFLMLDGTVLVRATYPDLFAVLGTAYNTGGETVSQFRLPDFRGRVLAQKAASGTFATLGSTGGAETVTLTYQNMPAQVPVIIAGATGYYWNAPTGPDRVNGGSGTAVNKLPPYATVNRAVKF